MVCVFCFTEPSEVNINTWVKTRFMVSVYRRYSELTNNIYIFFYTQPQTHIVSVAVQHHFNVLKTSIKLLICTRCQLSQNSELWTCSVLK